MASKERNHEVAVTDIAGGIGSGKTTAVRKIAEALPPNHVAVIPLDSYYDDTSEMTEEGRRTINFNHPDAFDWKLLIKQVNELRRDKPIEQPTYSYLKYNRLLETIHVGPWLAIIIEDIMTLLNRRSREMVGLKVFVDYNPDERFIRNIQRDIIEWGWDVNMVVQRYSDVLKSMHEQFIRPTKRFADMTIPQGRGNLKGISILCKYVERLVLMDLSRFMSSVKTRVEMVL